MVSLFTESVPAENTAVQSSEIRENFEALYDKVKTLEARAQDPNSFSILVLGGPVYFRSSTSNRLRLINFNPTIFDFTIAQGFKTQLDQNGALFRSQQAFLGPSQFQSQGLFLEVLVSLRSDGRLVFTEALQGQNNTLSSPFNIFFDDGEVPIALVVLERSSEGVLQTIAQERIREARPFVTTAFQNNQQIATIEDQVQDNTTRISIAESSLRITDKLATRLPPSGKLEADLTTTTNTQVEVFSGSALDGYQSNFLKFAGANVDFSTSPSSDPRVFDAGVAGLGLAANRWNKGLISLQYDAAISDGENSKLVVTHGTDAVTPDQVVDPVVPTGSVPLSFVLYRMNSSATDIVPLISEIFMDTFRLDYQFTISTLIEAPTSNPNTPAFLSMEVDLSGTGFSQSFVETILFQSGDPIDIFDENTQPLRRFVDTTSFNTLTEIATITVTNSFVEISLLRNPQVRSVSQHQDLIEDVRPFLGIS